MNQGKCIVESSEGGVEWRGRRGESRPEDIVWGKRQRVEDARGPILGRRIERWGEVPQKRFM